MKKKWEEELVGQMTNLQKLLESNNGGDGYFVGNDVSCTFKLTEIKFLATFLVRSTAFRKGMQL